MGFYDELNEQLRTLVDGVPHRIANLANAAALLYQEMDRINWAGFYIMKKDLLVLGPFQGKPACIEIPLGRGVCGTAAEQRKTVVVPDVHAFPGHIACDTVSASEIVVPLVCGGELFGVLDIDSPEKNRFSEEDQRGLEKFAAILEEMIRKTERLGL